MGKIFNLSRLTEEYLQLKKVRLIAALALVVAIILSGSGVAVAALANRGVGVGLMLGGLILAVIAVAVIITVANKIKNHIRETLIEGSAKRVLEGVDYKADGCVCFDTVKTADMDFDFEYDSIVGCDLVTGSYNGKKVEMSELRLVTVKTDSDGEGGEVRKEKGEFKGIWCTVDFGAEFPCELMVKERSNKFSKLAAKVFGSSKSIATDNKEFNASFITSSDDDESALKLLSEGFVKAVLDFEKEVAGGVYLRISRSGKLHIAVETSKPLFKMEGKLPLEELSDRFADTVFAFMHLTDRI